MIKKIKLSTFFRMAAFIKPYARRYLTGLIGSSLLGFLQSLFIAIAFKDLTNAVLAGNMDNVVHMALMLFAAICVFSGFNAFFIYWTYAYYRSIAGDVRKEMFSHIMRFPMSYVENAHSGDLLSRINNDLWTGLHMLGDPISQLLGALFSGMLSGITIFILNWKLGLVALVFGALTTVVNICLMKPVRTAQKTVQEKLSIVYQTMTDTIMGSQVIKIFNLQKTFFKSFQAASGGMAGGIMKVVRIESLLAGFNSLGGYLNYVGILVIGCILILQKQTDFGTLVAIIEMVGSFFVLFVGIGGFAVRVNSGLASAERIFETMDEPDEDQLHRERGAGRESGEATAVQPDESVPVPVIDFSDVSFSYKDRSTVLERFSLSVYKDQVVAVVGSSGSGKSTLFKILLGFYESDAGDIRICGKSYYDFTLPELRNFIAYVPQESYLFSGTIRDNISWGKEQASDDEIVEAATAAYAHDFIMKLPNGYDTDVGERGARLSGGERQRVAIARALLKNAPILLLDEATSSLDSESERQVQQALEVLMKGRTTMVIAHRLSTIRHADRIIVLENGAICEDGTHSALIEKDGVYAYLYNLQFAANA
jgi:ATP-binding cassette, subfamily B, bacterial